MVNPKRTGEGQCYVVQHSHFRLHLDPLRPQSTTVSNAAPLAGREKLLDQWLEKTISLNPDKDILLVDTPDNGRPSPIDPRHGEFVPYTSGLRAPRMKMVFPITSVTYAFGVAVIATDGVGPSATAFPLARRANTSTLHILRATPFSGIRSSRSSNK